MPDKKDISQIRKYLNGELDARAMHELERRVQDDPLLMDALEGYEQAKGDQKANLADLANRLQQRTEAKVKRMFPWVPVSVAASVLIVLGVGMWMATNKQPEKPQQTAALVKPEVKEKPAEKQLLHGDSAPTISAPAAAKYNAKQSGADKESIVADANSAPAVAQSQEYKSTEQFKNVSPKIDTSLFVRKPVVGRSAADSTSFGYNSPNVTAKKFNADQPLKTKMEGVNTTPKVARNNNAELAKMGLPTNPEIAQNTLDKPRYQPRQDSPALNEMVITSKYASKDKKAVTGSMASVNPMAPGTGKVLTGRVVGKDDGQPIVGATVKVKGANFGVVTNLEGKFVLRNVGSDQTLAVAYIGYNSKNVSVNNKDSLNIVLEPNSSSLSEVVVTGYSVTHKDNDALPYDDPRPKDGWSAFKKYLSTNAKSTEGKTGKVRLSFTVDPSGNFSDFKVTKSLGKAADQKAIDLIQQGPKWIGATDGQAHEVKLTVKFN